MVYLDNSATTKPSKKAIEYINNALNVNWGNPSSLHLLGMEAEMLVDKAREAVAKSISALPGEIIFTGSGTEANNTAIMSALAKKSMGNKIITTEIEHPSVLNTVKRLEDEGFQVEKIGIGKDGKILLSQLEEKVDSKTVLVSIMLVNNEIGSLQPIADAVKLVKKIAPRAIFHCDAVQGYGKVPINVKNLGVDLLTASGHKIHGPKGIGFLYCKKGVAIKPFITGGGQEKGMRSGTEPVPLIAGLLGAVEDLPDIKKQYEKTLELRNYAVDVFLKSGIAEINSPNDAIPYILNISVTGYRSETLLHFLEAKEIYVSSGSACAKGEQSYVLSALGLNRARSDSALRLSFSKDTSKEDIDRCLEALTDAAKRLTRSKI
jgi:cysteine desulfurase